MVLIVLQMKKSFVIDNHLSMAVIAQHYSVPLFSLVDNNRQYLRQWLSWLDVTTCSEDTKQFIKQCEKQYRNQTGCQFLLFYQQRIIGVFGFNSIDNIDKKAIIGYWLAEDYTGNGYMTKAIGCLLELGFYVHNLNKLEIYCATENHPSRALAERMNFKFDGILRQNQWLYQRFVDHAVYSLLRNEYSLSTAPGDFCR